MAKGFKTSEGLCNDWKKFSHCVANALLYM